VGRDTEGAENRELPQRRKRLVFSAVLSSVHISNNVEATVNNFEATIDLSKQRSNLLPKMATMSINQSINFIDEMVKNH